MIRVRYRDFRSGSYGGTWQYGSAERCGHGVTVYLLPGLVGWQRRAVIRRLRQEASRGCGPELPLPGLIIALGVDRVRMGLRLTGSVVRAHPAATLLPSAVAVAAMTLFVLAAASGGEPGAGVRGGRVMPVIESGARLSVAPGASQLACRWVAS